MTPLENMLLESLRSIDSEYRRRDQELAEQLTRLISRLNDLTRLVNTLEVRLSASTRSDDGRRSG